LGAGRGGQPNCGQRAIFWGFLLRLQSDNNTGHLSLFLHQTSFPRSAKWSCETSRFWLGCHQEQREARAPESRRRGWGWGRGRGGGGRASCPHCISTEGGETQGGSFVINERKTNSAGRWFPPLKLGEERAQNQWLQQPDPGTPRREASFCKAVPLRLPHSFFTLGLVGGSWVLVLFGFVFFFFKKRLITISFSMLPAPSLPVTVWPSCPPAPVRAQAGCLAPLDVVCAVAPLFSLHPRPGPAPSSVRVSHASPSASRAGRPCFSLA